MRILCPACPQETKIIRGREVLIGKDLDIIETNYSGCGVDIAFCETCQKKYQISYKVDQITEVE